MVDRPMITKWKAEMQYLGLPVWNVFFSWLGYALFGGIVYACHKHGIIRKRAHDVFLVLSFALVADVLEMAKYAYFIITLKGRDAVEVPLAVCTVYSALYVLPFLRTYVESFISIHRFIVHFCGISVPVFPAYIGMGLVFSLKACLMVVIIVGGRVSESIFHSPHAYCERDYILGDGTLLNISAYSFLVSLAITAFLSTLIIIKGFVKKQHESDVSSFLLISSISLAVLPIGFLLMEKIIEFEKDTIIMVMVPLHKLQDFRFLLLCVLATLIISEIKRAVLATLSEAVKKCFGRQKVSFKVQYELCPESGEKIKEIEFGIASLD